MGENSSAATVVRVRRHGRPLGGGPPGGAADSGNSREYDSDDGAIGIVAMNIRGLASKAAGIVEAVRSGELRDDIVAVMETMVHTGEHVCDMLATSGTTGGGRWRRVSSRRSASVRGCALRSVVRRRRC